MKGVEIKSTLTGVQALWMAFKVAHKDKENDTKVANTELKTDVSRL